MKTLENAVRAEAATILQNHLLKVKDILEWSTSEEVVRGNAKPGEVVIEIPLGAWVCVEAKFDKRTINAKPLVSRLPEVAKPEPPGVDKHPADRWINSLYTGNVGGDTRNKIRRGFDEGYQRGIIEGRKQIEQEIAGELLGQAQENGR